MNKALVIFAIIGLLVFAGCAPTQPVQPVVKKAPTVAEPELKEATKGIVAETDTVEIGSMI